MKTKEDFLKMIKLADTSLKTLDIIAQLYSNTFVDIAEERNKISGFSITMKSGNKVLKNESTSEGEYETKLSKELRKLEEIRNHLKSDIIFDNQEVQIDIIGNFIDELKEVAEKQNSKINSLSYNNIDTPIDNKEIITNLNDKFKEYIKIDEKTEKNIHEIYLNIEVLEKQMIDFTGLFYALMSDIEAKATEFGMEEQFDKLKAKIATNMLSLKQYLKNNLEPTYLEDNLEPTNTKTPESYIQHSSKLKESEEKLFKIIHKISTTKKDENIYVYDTNKQEKSLKNILNKLKDFLNKIKSKIKGEEGSYDLISSDTDKQSKNILNKLKDFLNNIKQKITVNKTSKEGSIEEIIIKGPTQTFVKTNANSEENLEFHSNERNSLERSDSFESIDEIDNQSVSNKGSIDEDGNESFVSIGSNSIRSGSFASIEDSSYYSAKEDINENVNKSISDIESIENDQEYPSSRNKSFTETLKEERDVKDSSQKEIS